MLALATVSHLSHSHGGIHVYSMCKYEGMYVMLALRNLAHFPTALSFKVHWLYLIGNRDFDVSCREKCFSIVFKEFNLRNSHYKSYEEYFQELMLLIIDMFF